MTDLRGRSVNSSPYLPTYLMYYGTHFLQEIAGPPPHTRRVLGSVDYLCSLLEKERIFLKTLEKPPSWRRELNGCQTIISMTTLAVWMNVTFLCVRAICGTSYKKENHKLSFAIKKRHLQLLNVLTAHAELAKVVGVIMSMHQWRSLPNFLWKKRNASLSFDPVLQNHVVGQCHKSGNRMSPNLQLWTPDLKKYSQNPRQLHAICSFLRRPLLSTLLSISRSDKLP